MYPQFAHLAGKSIHLGVCGSVAAYKALDFLRVLLKNNFLASSTLTESAERFVSSLSFEALGSSKVFRAMFEQTASHFAHLEPGAEADAFVILPASASTMARLAAGSAETMLAAQCLAFEGPLLLAPAMNPRMWRHQATQDNVSRLRERGAVFILPDSGLVACGEEGQGKLAALSEVYFFLLRALSVQDMCGKTVLLTLGPTREPWDAVRFWSNPSSGLMGSCLALAAWMRGARVLAVIGPGTYSLPGGILRYPVQTAAEMHASASELWPEADFGIFTAAVADFSPVPCGLSKFKKVDAQGGFSIRFTPNKDILADLSSRKTSTQRILGFAAETEMLAEQARSKLSRKQFHLVAANWLNKAGSGFGSSTNCMYVCDYLGREEEWPLLPKTDIAWRLLDWLLTL